MKDLTGHIRQYFGCSELDASGLQNLFEEQHLKKGDFHTREGQYNSGLSFILSGCMRVYRIADGKEYTQWLSGHGEFITDIASLSLGKPARWNITSLTDCKLYTLSASDYPQIKKFVPDWPEIEKLFLAKCFMIMEDRVFSFLSLSAEERYDWFSSERSELLNYVPLQYLASMLGMSPETLSRIRNKKLS
ncbi:MAG: Crp/Fnr family transcriptional regulator [Cyclobacteriaceae bacterium]